MRSPSNSFPLGRSLAVWAVIIIAETMNGIFREVVITPITGDVAGQRISFGVALIAIAVVAAAFDRWLNYISIPQALTIGVIWVVLTFTFEVSLTVLSDPDPIQRLASDYDPRNGGLMAFGMIYLLFAPMIGRRLRRVFAK